MLGATKKLERGPRLSADDWARAALDQIAEDGVAAVAVEPLARRLGVTKGSFYWHFPSREALLKAALERWEQVELEEVFARVEAIVEPRDRMRELFRRVAHEVKSHVIYSELARIPVDVARVEHLTFVCTTNRDDAGPNNNWMAPARPHAKMDALFAGLHEGRTLYVVPYCMGPIDSPYSRCGVEITDSAYVVINMRIMTRMGRPALSASRAKASS
jgi:AcrR family transcriptional regulator